MPRSAPETHVEHAIPWPSYSQWIIEVAPMGCLGVVLGVASAVGVRMLQWGSRVEMLALIGVPMVVLMGPVWLVNLFNILKMLVWWGRIRRFTTWRRVRKLAASNRNEYLILGRPLFRGGTSFGTYQVCGGWDAFVLRRRFTADLWVILGNTPKDLEDLGLDLQIEGA